MDNNKILLIDDQLDILPIIQYALKEYNIKAADSGPQGLNLYDDWQPDLVLLDYVMPEMNGLEVLKEIHSKNPFQPVLLMSGTESVTLASAFMREGAVDYIVKPVDTDLLRSRVSWVFNTYIPTQFLSLQTKLREKHGEVFRGWVSMMRHKIDTPLRTILKTLETIEKDAQKRSTIADEIRELSKAGKEIDRILGQLKEIK